MDFRKVTPVSVNYLENVTQAQRSHLDLPEINDGQHCVPGKLYRNECNTCKCTKDGALMCTKMGCIAWNKKYYEKKALRDKKPKVQYLPKVPKEPCQPGKLYRSGCRRCFCDDKNKISCSKKLQDACIFDKEGNPVPIITPEDIRPSFSLVERSGLEALSSASEECTPGKTYKVDCNKCVCRDNSDLLCTRKLCISYDDMSRMAAEEMSGKKCRPDKVPEYKCVKCKCSENTTECEGEQNCTPALIQKLSQKQELKTQLTADGYNHCVPSTIYRDNCNKCYCQADGSLRCTQKTCLKHSQVKLLKEQQDYLEKHGL